MKISLLHLQDGIHQFKETISGGTLGFYRSELFPNDIHIAVQLNKFIKNITCLVEVNTSAHFLCDRCLKEFDRIIEERSELLFHIGRDKLETEEEEVILLTPEQKEIDLTSYISEMLILSVPMKILCEENCKGICPNCGIDLNTDSCSCNEEVKDYRWEELRKLRNKN